MLKQSNRIFLCLSVLFTVFVFSGCKCVPPGNAPEQVLEIEPTVKPGEPVSWNEAVNLMSTELAVTVLPKLDKEPLIQFRHQKQYYGIASKLYHEMRLFVNVKSVIDNYNYTIDTGVQSDANNRKWWHVRLKDKSGKVIWYECVAIKNEEFK